VCSPLLPWTSVADGTTSERNAAGALEVCLLATAQTIRPFYRDVFPESARRTFGARVIEQLPALRAILANAKVMYSSNVCCISCEKEPRTSRRPLEYNVSSSAATWTQGIACKRHAGAHVRCRVGKCPSVTPRGKRVKLLDGMRATIAALDHFTIPCVIVNKCSRATTMPTAMTSLI
jgi:hypothetical protein